MSTFQVLANYHSADYELIRTIKSQLAAQANRIAVGDSSACVIGAAWPQKLLAKLKATQATLVFIGKCGLSQGQKRLIGLTLTYQTRLEQSGQRFPIIPVLLPEADLAPAFLFNDAWIDLRAGITNPQALQKLVQAATSPIGQRRPPLVMVDHCPYRGFRPFREEDAAFFFGQEVMVERLLTSLQQHRWVTLSGPTGSGKTSLIRAGLLPHLRRQTAPVGRWEIVYVRPLNGPLVQLAAGLLGVTSSPELTTLGAATLASQLANQEQSLPSLIDEILPKSTLDTRLLLVIDQFEELVTSSSPEQGALFLNVLQSVLDHPALTLLIVLRSENYGQLMDFNQTIADQLTNDVIQVTPLPPDALRQTILKPARLVTMAVEPTLVQHLIDTTTKLSQLQFCLTELWQQNRDGLLNWAAYERIGGLEGAASYRAEQIFDTLSPTQQRVAGQILCGLADVSHPAGMPAPQRVKLADLYARISPPKFSTLYSETGNAIPKVPSPAVGNTVIEAFARGGLLTITKPLTDDDDFVELATPALIEQWPRFRIWLDQAQAFRLWRRRLTPALAEWEQSSRSLELLLRQDALFEAKRRLRDDRDQLDKAEQTFIQQSLARQRRAQASGWIAWLAALALLLLIISALFLRQFSAIRQVAEQRDLALSVQAQTELALQQAKSEQAMAVAHQQVTEQQRQAALARQLAGQARLILNDPDGHIPKAMILAVESARRFPSLESQQVLRAGLARLPRPVTKLHHDDEVREAIFSPSGRWLATRSGSIARIWDVTTGEELARLKHDDVVNDIAFSPDSHWLVTASLDHTARIWDVHTGQEVARMRHDTRVWEVAFSSDGQWLATRSDQEASVWHLTPGTAGPFTPTASTTGVIEPDTPLTFVQLSDGQPRPETTGPVIGSGSVRMAHDEAVLAMAFSEDARWLTTASSDHTARVWEVATGREIYRLPHQDSVEAVAFSPNGRFLATGGSDNSARIWPLNTSEMTSSDAMPTNPKMIRLLHRNNVNQVVFSPNSNWLVTVSDDNVVRGWRLTSDPDSKVVIPQLKTQMKHQARIEAVTFSPNGRWLVTASADQTARIWLVTTGQELAQLPHLSSVNDVVFSPDGQRLATASNDHTAQLWPAVFGYEVAQHKHQGWVFSVDFSPDGRWLATRNGQTVQILESATGREITRLKHRYYVNAIAFSPEGHTIATGSYRTAQLWDVLTGEEVIHLTSAGQTRVLAFSPDGRRLATAGIEKIVWIWDVETGQVIAELPHNSWVKAITFSPDGQWLATASNDNTARVWDAATGQEVSRLEHDAVVTQIAFSPDGQWLATASGDHTARIWLTNSVWESVRMPHSSPVMGVTFSPDGRWLATRSRQLVQVWDAATGERMTEMKHGGSVETIIFSPDSWQLATASDDNRTVHVWDVTTGQEITRVAHKYGVNAVAFSPDGRWLATASADYTTRIWLLRQKDLLAEVCARLPRNLTPQEWQTYLPDDPYRATCPNISTVRE